MVGITNLFSMVNNTPQDVNVYRELEIKECYNKVDSGYFNPKSFPVENVGSCLEMTGKFLMALTKDEKRRHKTLIDEIIKGLESHADKGYSFIPRTAYYGVDEPTESKPNRWEKSNYTWYRTDVSHSQFTYLLQGLHDFQLATNLFVKGIQHIWRHDFILKRIDGTPADNGNLNQFWSPNVQLRKYYLLDKLGAKQTFATKFWFKAMQYIPWSIKGDNGLNTCLLYYSIMEHKPTDERILNKIREFVNSWLCSCEGVTTTSTVPTYDLKPGIHWLLMNKIQRRCLG